MSFSPSPRMGPSLKGLHALAKVAEAGSITGAARLLGVTPSAVSHLIADVETQLSLKLMERDRGVVTLTGEGRSLCEQIVPAFEQISEAVRRGRDQHTELKLSMVSTFALNWLMPRLPRFREAFPGVDVSISTTTRAVNLDIDGVDAAVRHGLGNWPLIEKQLIFKQVLIAVAAPKLVGVNPSLSNIASFPRIAAKHRTKDWSVWNDVSNVSWGSRCIGVSVETRALAIAAAISGSGILVIDSALVSEELLNRRLVQISETRVPCEEGYWMVWSKGRTQKPSLRRFREWIITESKCARESAVV